MSFSSSVKLSAANSLSLLFHSLRASFLLCLSIFWFKGPRFGERGLGFFFLSKLFFKSIIHTFFSFSKSQAGHCPQSPNVASSMPLVN